MTDAELYRDIKRLANTINILNERMHNTSSDVDMIHHLDAVLAETIKNHRSAVMQLMEKSGNNFD